MESFLTLSLLILILLASPLRCDKDESGLASGNVNVTSNIFFNNNKKTSKAVIDNSDVVKSYENNSNTVNSTFTTSEDVQDSQQQQIPLVRLPSNTLLKYTAYKDVSIQHFLIPMDSRSVFFSFKAYEESKSALSK